MSSARRIPVYRGHFGPEQAERLLWRAGFGPRPGEEKRLAKKGLHGAVHSLTHPKHDRLIGPKPVDDDGHPIAPIDAWGHDHLWWLDRMVRSNRPLVERMTLVWHDWFATSNAGVGSQRLMLQQNGLFRSHCLGSFYQLLLAVTRDPAMLLWLNGTENEKDAPNENYGREMMELFTLGASRGYSERDVREQARALTGWRNDWDDDKGPVNFRFDQKRHDTGTKRIFGKRGHFDWKDSCRLAVHHPKHASFFVTKLWSYFVPTAPPAPTRRALESLYVRHHYAVRPVVEAILKHPRALQRPAHGQAPGRLSRRDAARAPARDRHRRLDVALEPGRPAALLPAERLGLGRHALARHGVLPRALEPRRSRAAAVGAERRRQGAARTRRSCSTARSPTGASRDSRPRRSAR